MAEQNKDELLEWYNGLPGQSDQQTVVVVKGEEDNAPPKPTLSDLSTVPDDSQQVDIQKEILSKSLQNQDLMSKNDELIAQNKMNAHKAYGLVKVIEEKLKIYSYLSGKELDDPMRLEGITGDIKTIINELSQVAAKL